MEIELSGTQVLLAFLAIAAVILVLIFVLRNIFGTKDNLSEKYAGSTRAALLKSRVKYPEVDVFKHSGTFFGFGLASALALTVFGFSWTDYEKQIDVSQYSLEVDEEIEIEPPRTAEPPPPPPPPPPPVIEEVPEEEIEEEEQPEFEDQTVEEETVFEEAPPPPKEVAPPPPPPPPPPPAPDVEEIFKVVEQMPLFGGCTDKACSDKKLIQFLYKSLKYPAIARENGVEGRVYIQFVVERDGKVTDGKIVRDIGAGCGEAALKVVNSMNDLAQAWKPGKQRGQSVRVLYTLPVTFKLES
ncbi:MAG: protein TonB [Saprospiraceae bacterium]|jgi:protein TonB